MTMGAVSMHPAARDASEQEPDTTETDTTVTAPGTLFNPPEDNTCLPVAADPVVTDTGDIPSVWLVEAHAGAGADTAEQIFAPFANAGAVIPAANEWPAVVIVAASHMPGIVAAHQLVRQFNTRKVGGAQLLGVLLVDQTGEKYPKELTRRIKTVGSIVSSVWTLPYIPAWRGLLIKERPVWSPDDGVPTGKAAKKINPATAVPAEVCAVGDEIHSTSLNLLKQMST